jgi:hypothetical protein
MSLPRAASGARTTTAPSPLAAALLALAAVGTNSAAPAANGRRVEGIVN